MLVEIEVSLKKHFDARIVDELLAAYQDCKRNFFLGGLRLSAVEGGRFCEAALRLLEQITTQSFTDLNQQIDSAVLITRLANLPKNSHSASVRLHIPRAIRVVYDIRNGRDAAHLADGIDPNLQDATLVVTTLDWILAEFTRLYHGVTASEAQQIIDGLVARTVPAVQDFGGFLKILKPSLKVSDYLILLLYERNTLGAPFDELQTWVKPPMRANLRRTLRNLVDDNAFAHEVAGRFFITKLGAAEVERRNLHGTQ
jgi:hypothetical protein